MDKLFAALGIAGIIFGALFIPRIARGDETVSEIDLDTLPGRIPENAPRGTSPRGIGNNNPFNLIFLPSVQWRGQLGTDGRFAVFDTPLNGIRAGIINIHTKFTRDGLNTVRKLLNRLSPSFENPTEAFITFVSKRLNVAPDQPLVFSNVIIPLSKAIIQFENGEQPYSDALIRQALQESNRA